MRIMLDTNVIISMILFPSKKFLTMLDLITKKHTLVLSSFVIDELFKVADKKFPQKKDVIDVFLSELNYELVYTPHKMKENLFTIRDINDYPVLYTAIIDNVDILITGDKDFLNIEVEKPEILTPTDFLIKYS